MTVGDAAWLCAFAASLVAVLAASDRLVRAVEAAGDRFALPPGLVGLLAAAGADGPEVTAAIISRIKGEHEVGLGVILGSNLFNLAALLGIPVLIVGPIAVQRYGLVLNGGLMLLVTGPTALLIAGVVPALPTALFTCLVLVGYAALLIVPRQAVPARLAGLIGGHGQAPEQDEAAERAREREEDEGQGFPSSFRLIATGSASTVVVIGGCALLVNATLYLGPWLHLPRGWIGTFGLAILTSLPNLWVALALARRRRGAVLMSTVCNSNTINLIFGVCLPAVFVALTPSVLVHRLDVPVLSALTLLALGLVWRNRGLGRIGAACLVTVYLAYAVSRTLLG
ncbi:MAG: sodium:calcium antiporter [Chloroflexota bacterium]